MMVDRLLENGGVTVVVPSWTQDLPGVRAALSTRIGGVSRNPFDMNTSFSVGDEEGDVRTNRDRFFRAAGIPGERLATAGQVHGSAVVAVGSPGHYPGCDGLVTDTVGLVLGVSIADCVPILIYDAVRRAAGIVHSGWKGSRGRIVEKCLRLMGERFSTRPADIFAYIGPAASGCCYEVGPEVADQFPPEALRKTEVGRAHLDLGVFNRNLLVECGVPGEQVALSGRCTIHEADLFHSHRRDSEQSGRMLAIIHIVE